MRQLGAAVWHVKMPAGGPAAVTRCRFEGVGTPQAPRVLARTAHVLSGRGLAGLMRSSARRTVRQRRR
jgi:hypothetical protein